MSEVPEGQVPRDEAFWRTFDAVRDEQEQAWAVLRCEREGHTFSFSENRCVDCGTPYDEAMKRMGFVARGNSWVLEHPSPGGSGQWTIGY